MKFLKVVEQLQQNEENKGKIVIVKCGAFFVAIGKDALILNKIFGFKVTCMRKKLCKVGIPINSILRYSEILENKGYSFLLYDYDKEKSEYILKYSFMGKENQETNDCLECEKCQYNKYKSEYEEINIFDVLKKRQDQINNNNFNDGDNNEERK